ncbi:MAG: hypothetical protein ABSD48_09585 [Armatimonadota bacterium]
MDSGRIPMVFIVDDPPINVSYYLRKQQSDRGILPPSRGDFSKFLDRWPEMEPSRIVPNAFWRKLIEWAQAVGVKGKFTLLPCPAGLGCIDDHVDGYADRELSELIELVRVEYTKNFDITPEILTHTLAWDIEKREMLPITEHEWMARQDGETLAAYMAEGLRILKSVGIVARGITQPCSFSGDEHLYARAVLEAEKRVNGIRHTFYFLNTDADSAPVPSPVMIADEDRDEFVVSVVSASMADEPFWTSIYGGGEIPTMADYYISRDGAKGRFVDLLRSGGPIVFHAHSQTLYSNGTEKGFMALQEVVRRVGEHIGDRVEWMKIGEFADRVIEEARS